MQKSFFGKKKEEKAEDKDDGKKKLGLFNKSKRDLSPSPEGSEDGKEEKGGFFAKRKGSFSAKIKSDDNPADSEQKEKRSPFSLRKDPNRDSKKSLANVAVALMAKKKEDKMEEETIGVAPKESLNTQAEEEAKQKKEEEEEEDKRKAEEEREAAKREAEEREAAQREAEERETLEREAAEREQRRRRESAAEREKREKEKKKSKGIFLFEIIVLVRQDMTSQTVNCIVVQSVCLYVT